MEVTRRDFLKKSISTATIGAISLSPIGTLATFLTPAYPMVKPGGHLLLAHHCIATFIFENEYQQLFGKEPIQLYLGGSGYASFTNLQDYSDYDINQIFNENTVAMEWEVNHCYAGNMPSFGTVAARGQVKKNGNNRSYIFFNSKQPQTLFPAVATNILFFELEFPNLQTKLFNSEPIIFSGDVQNIDRKKDILSDLRYKNRPDGLSDKFKANLGEQFEPVGSHRLVNPVRFYLSSNPKKHVATLVKSELETQIHYGLDIELAECKLNQNNVDATFKITNLSRNDQRLSWYVGDSYDLTIFNVYSNDFQINNQKSIKEGRVSLAAGKSVTLNVQAYNNNPAARLGDKACLFCGAHNTPKELNAFNTKFISGFAVAEGEDFRRVSNRGGR